MAKGHTRAPSQNAYKGSLGLTQTETVHVTGAHGELIAATVYTSVDAVSNPELADRLFSGTLNTVRIGSVEAHLAVPVVFHDPAAEVFALVLADGHRHRELDERIRLLERLRDDRGAVPLYVKEHAVVFGPAGLRLHLEERAQQEQARVLAQREAAREHDRKRADLAAREADLQRAQQQIAQQQAEIDRSKAELDRMRAESRARVIAAAQIADTTTIAPSPSKRVALDDVSTTPVRRQDIDELDTVLASSANQPTGSDFEQEATSVPSEPATGTDADPSARGRDGAYVRASSVTSFEDSEQTGDDARVPVGLLDGRGRVSRDVEVDEEPTGNTEPPAGSDPLTTETRELPVDTAIASYGRAGARSTHAGSAESIDVRGLTASRLVVKDSTVRMALVAGDGIARGLHGALDVRVLLHRMSSYPVVLVLVGPPIALRIPNATQVIVVPMDIAGEPDRSVLIALAKRFEITVDIVVRGNVMRRVRLTAPLAESIAFILRAADDHLRGITADGETDPSYARARDLVIGAGYDLLGVEHAESSEFRDDKLTTLETAQDVRRAISVARRFARPSGEDYLVCARGYPLARWRDIRRRVLERAVAWGLWMGPELAQLAVSEGLARSRRDLVLKLAPAFDELGRNAVAFDIDAEAADDNRKAIAAEAKALGVDLATRKVNGAIKSEDVPMVAGSIERAQRQGLPSPARSVEELLKLLEERDQRVAAATELCERADPRAAVAVISAVKKMSRAEAVRVLGRSVKFGPAAAPPLIEGLQSSKAYLRHGCALALALLRTDQGTHAVVEQLLAEPTEIWREIARALGQVGPAALLPLASKVGRLGDEMTPGLQERVAWAMAHVGVRGGKPALEQMSAGQSVMAPVARQALGLHENAVRDEVRVRPGPLAGKDVTVNRAFSRRFFESLETDRPDEAQAALHDMEASGPMELLDDVDLIEEVDDEAAELDESDLIQS